MSIKIRPIKNNRDYREALNEIDRVMDARPNTVEGDRLDFVSLLNDCLNASSSLRTSLGLKP
ncbi:MAG TPA: hypothetical protein VJ023_03175 [Pyrinomonadaceae bacterium]|nr:hypothetical protein [Pyrinomonadaceae bacterium]